jgi:predicted SAM-dependent methyltransferase
MQLNPADERVHSHWLLSQLYRKGEGAAEMLDLHRAWARRHARDFGWQAARAEHERRPERRLNIGYVSADFKRHSVAYFVEPLLAAHDRARYKIFCYSGAARPDEVTRRIRECCEEWRDISRLSDDWVAEQMRADRIDILVDLAGHTGSGRMLLFARKPAPVQVTWLGYPGTTGLAALDYRITDPIADPEGAADGAYVEKLHRLPAGFLCYGPPSDCPAVVEPPCLGSGRVTFGCFNHLPKLTPATVALWARLLEAVPQARLLLKSFGLSAQSARDALLEQFAAHGIGVERLLLRGPQESLAGHLAAYGEVDIALDVFPYNGTTTTCEALWMGVPVITLAGGTHVSRVGASILSQAGMPDLVAASPEEYLRKACALAADRPRLQSLRAGMRARLQGTPLLDATAFARSIEGAYDGMWRRWQETGEETKMPLRLHIGGTSVLPGWKILNAIPGPGVDYTGDCSDLSQFADESVDEIYASHVLEHVGLLKLPGTFAGIHRVLKKGGAARISVPDFELLCRMSLDPRYNAEQRFNLMVMVFGAQHDAFDFHYVGFTFEFLRDYLLQAGFSSIERVQEIGLLDDTSTTKFNGIPISLNVVALK